MIVFVTVVALNLTLDRCVSRWLPAKSGRWLAVSSLTALALIVAGSVWHGYQGNYMHEPRLFYCQCKSLMHYLRKQNLKFLSYGGINDEVLKSYFLDDAGPVPPPSECRPGDK